MIIYEDWQKWPTVWETAANAIGVDKTEQCIWHKGAEVAPLKFQNICKIKAGLFGLHMLTSVFLLSSDAVY